MPLGGHRFGQPGLDVLLVEEHLPLQVVGFDEITVNDSDFAHPGPHQQAGDVGAQRAAADDDGAAAVKPGLAFLADARKHRLAGVSVP